MTAPVQYVEEDYDSASVGYWRLRQPQFTDSDVEATASDSDSDDGDSEYEILAPSDASTSKILDASSFYERFMPPRSDFVSEALFAVCSSAPVRMTPIICAALVRRFTTDVRFNWETKTLQSFLEVAVWTSVTLATLSLYDHDWLFALQVGTFAGALMSVCDEVVLHFVRGLARVIRNQRGGRELLERLGFDVPANGKAPTDGHEVALIKTLVFGYLGVVGLRALAANLHDVTSFALLAAAAGAAFVVIAEFFCLWLPTRRVGLTLQSRFTQTGAHWRDHPVRSAIELTSWAATTLCLYAHSADFSASLQLGTLVAVAVCLSSGLDDLPDIVSSDDTSSALCAFWEDRASGDAFLRLADVLVRAQNAVAQRALWRH